MIIYPKPYSIYLRGIISGGHPEAYIDLIQPRYPSGNYPSKGVVDSQSPSESPPQNNAQNNGHIGAIKDMIEVIEAYERLM